MRISSAPLQSAKAAPIRRTTSGSSSSGTTPRTSYALKMRRGPPAPSYGGGAAGVRLGLDDGVDHVGEHDRLAVAVPPLRLAGVARREREGALADVHRDRDHVALVALGAVLGLWTSPRSVSVSEDRGRDPPAAEDTRVLPVPDLLGGRKSADPARDDRTVAATRLEGAVPLQTPEESFSGPPRRRSRSAGCRTPMRLARKRRSQPGWAGTARDDQAPAKEPRDGIGAVGRVGEVALRMPTRVETP